MSLAEALKYGVPCSVMKLLNQAYIKGQIMFFLKRNAMMSTLKRTFLFETKRHAGHTQIPTDKSQRSQHVSEPF